MNKRCFMESVWWILIVCAIEARAAENQFIQLTGWGGGKPEKIVPRAAEVGFTEIVVWNKNPSYLRRLVAVAQRHQIGVYASIHLNDISGWKKRYPDLDPPLQEMNERENEALKRILSDKSKGKSNYQYGGEPHQEIEVLTSKMLCFHHPKVPEFFRAQIRDILSVPGMKGVAFDYFGYRNYRCCRCERSMRAVEAYHKTHARLSREKAVERFSLETLVDFNNTLADGYFLPRLHYVKTDTGIFPVR